MGRVSGRRRDPAIVSWLQGGATKVWQDLGWAVFEVDAAEKSGSSSGDREQRRRGGVWDGKGIPISFLHGTRLFDPTWRTVQTTLFLPSI